MDGWISVKDRLPEMTSDVLVRLTTNEMMISFYRNDGYWSNCGGAALPVDLVAYWQPLPKPPKETFITPEQAASEMERIRNDKNGDTELLHAEMDDLMVKLLRQLGYEAAAEIFDNTYKWYA